MERLRRTASPQERLLAHAQRRQTFPAARKMSLGKAAGNFQSRLIRIVKWRGEEGTQSKKKSLFLTVLFRLPRELHIAILSHLSISDLLSLRLSCRALNDLLSACGPALVRFWIKSRLGSLHVQLYPPPGPDAAHFHYLLAMRRRHIASVRLTRELANFVFRDLLKQQLEPLPQHQHQHQHHGTNSNPNDRTRQMWTSVYDTLLPLVFVVGYFLDEHRRAILERDLGCIRPRCHVGYDVYTSPGILNVERAILLRLDQPLRLQYFYMYCFIVQVLTRKLRPPPCAGPLGRVCNNAWSRQPVCDEDIAFILVLGGINQISKLLACPSYTERRRLLHTFITRLSPHESPHWRRHWRDLGVTSPALLDEIPCAKIGVTKLGEIWEPLMRELMADGAREFTEGQRRRFGLVRRERAYVNELVGWDILRGRREEEEEEEEEEDGSVGAEDG